MSMCLLYSPILSTSSPGESHSIVEFIGQEIHGVLDGHTLFGECKGIICRSSYLHLKDVWRCVIYDAPFFCKCFVELMVGISCWAITVFSAGNSCHMEPGDITTWDC